MRNGYEHTNTPGAAVPGRLPELFRAAFDARTETRIEELTEERARLEIERTESLGLAELEDYATRVLGMQRPACGQIVTIGKLG